MPQLEFEEHFAELTPKVDALEALLATFELGKHFADLKRQIKILYEAMRKNHLLSLQVSFCPVTDIAAVKQSRREFAEGYFLKGR
jgi:hypothetical protein